MNDKTMIILGSTGSVGEQAIDVARRDGVRVSAISAHKNVRRVEEQAREFSVDFCAMSDEDAAKDLRVRLADTDIKVFSGIEGIGEMIAGADGDVVLNSIIGKAGLEPTLAAIDSGKRLALANKESLVVAGDIVMERARKNSVEVLPVDSEHCAIFQCLKAGSPQEIKKILLTASGGPFFGRTRDELDKISVAEALAHPTWKMGPKITVDSATLMNKGFEVIEAVHLFDVTSEQVEVVIHRESIIHSMVEYIDNSVIAQMSVPDMRLCVQYALNYPDRCEAIIDELDLFKISSLSFSRPDMDTFYLLKLAFETAKKGGALPAVLNAANEVAVAAFLDSRISFYKITELVSEVVTRLDAASESHSLEAILSYDREARGLSWELVNK